MRRRALLIGVPGGGINVSLAAERLEPLLEGLGFSVLRCIGARATRATVLAAIDRFIRQTQADDACFIHYFGHGGRIRFENLEGPYAGTIFGYVSTIRDVPGELAAVLDVELSARLTALDAICGNVTAMLDCCYSAELVRSGATPLSNFYSVPIRDGVGELLAESPSRLALESHPRIVRLCGASAQREAYADLRQGRHIGHMTDAFIDILGAREAEALGRICWGALIHELRERVIERLQFEGQWVALAGPRNRLLFQRRACELPATVSFVAPESEDSLPPGQGWIRAGWHQGVSVGDRWAVLRLELDEDGEPQRLGEGSIRSVERNRSILELDDGQAELPLASPAHPTRLGRPMPVRCDPAREAEIASSAWLRTDETEAVAALRELAPGFALEDLAGSRPRLRLPSFAEALEQLEQRARVWTLERSLAAHDPEPCALDWSCFRVGDDAPLPAAGASLRADERIWIEVHHGEKVPPHNWFFSAVLVEADGRPRLLNARMPEGIELLPLARETLGLRPGQDRRGFELRWPHGLDGDTAPLKLILLASRRPIPLAHIVREQPLDEDRELAIQGLVDPERQLGPSPTPACAWARLEFTLHRS